MKPSIILAQVVLYLVPKPWFMLSFSLNCNFHHIFLSKIFSILYVQFLCHYSNVYDFPLLLTLPPLTQKKILVVPLTNIF